MAGLCAIAAAAAAALACAARGQRWGVALTGFAASVAALILVVRLFVLPAIAAGTSRADFAAALRTIIADPGLLSSSPHIDHGTLFYWGAAVPTYRLGQDVEPPPFLLVTAAEWRRLGAAQRRQFRPVASWRMARSNNQGYPVLLQRVNSSRASGPP
jgi:hypothetical protein